MITKTEFEVWIKIHGKILIPYAGPFDSIEQAEKISATNSGSRYVVTVTRTVQTEENLVISSDSLWSV